MMNERQKELLKILLIENHEVFHIQNLANRLEVSEKTIRNDLNRIEEFLFEESNAKLIRKPGTGIKLEIDETDCAEILQVLFSNKVETNEERIIEIAFLLLTNNSSISVQELAKRYYVSNAVIKKDLDFIQNWLDSFDLKLISKPRLGNTIQGEELKKRNALAHLSQLLSEVEDKHHVLDLFLPYEITTVKKALRDMQNHYQLALTEDSMESLLIHALIMLKRTRQKSLVFIPDEEKFQAFLRKEYQYVRYFIEKLESAFRIPFPEEEKIYFSWHLISSKRKDTGIREKSVADEQLNEIVSNLIGIVEKISSNSFQKDTVLERGLTLHMHSVINRIKYRFPITNPLLSDIKKMYPYMFNMVVLSLHEIKEKFHLEIPEDEAAYLVLHFQAAIERMEESKKKRKKVLIVCHLGVGMSHLLEAKIKHYYQDIEILACIGKEDVTEYLTLHPVDFLISTVSLDKVNVPQIVISPLLKKRDKQKLHQFMEEMEYQRRNEAKKGNVLRQLMNKKLIFIDVKVEHRFELVELLGNELYEEGYVADNYTHSALARERMSATAIGGSIAIPHGNPKMIKRSVIAVAILQEPLKWGSEWVSIIFMLAISKDDQNWARDVVVEISTISENPKFVQKLSKVRDVMEFIEMMEE